MYKSKSFYFERFYLTFKVTNHWLDLLPRITFHLEELSRFVAIGWLFFQMNITLKWTEKQEKEYNGD